MKKLLYILLAVVLFLSFISVNVFAGEVEKAKQGEIEFAKAVANINDDLNIDAKFVSDEELKSVVGDVHNYQELVGGYGRDVRNKYSKMKVKKIRENEIYGEASLSDSIIGIKIGYKWKIKDNGKEGIEKIYNSDGSITVIQYWVEDGIQYEYVYTHYN